MLGSYLKAASGPRPVEYVGSVTKTANSSSGWDTPAEALDVLGVASEGDLVVIAFSFEDGDDSSWSWVGMSFTPIFDGTGVKDPGYYVGYKVVESGDSNPYVSGVGVGRWELLSVVASVFSNATTLGGSSQKTATSGGNLPYPPSLTASGRLWIVTGHIDVAGTADGQISTSPASYTLAGKATKSQSSSKSTTGIFYKIEDLDSDNPGAFNVNASSSDDYFVSTLAFN